MEDVLSTIVELSVLFEVHEKGEAEEDGEDQVEVEREESEVKEKRSCTTMNVDRMRLKNTLSHEVHVTQTSRGVTKLRALSACSQVVQLAREGVRVLVVDVVCVMLVLIARVVVQAVSKQFSQVSPFEQCQVHRRSDVSDEGCHQESCHCHHDEEELCHQFW